MVFYLHAFGWFYDKCRWIYHTWILWERFLPFFLYCSEPFNWKNPMRQHDNSLRNILPWESHEFDSWKYQNWKLHPQKLMIGTWLQGGPLNGVITPISRVFSPQWPIYFRPFIRLIIRLITPFVTGRGPPCRWWWWCLINIFLKHFTPNVLGFHDFHFDVYAPFFFKRGLKPQPAATWKISCDVNFQPTWNP